MHVSVPKLLLGYPPDCVSVQFIPLALLKTDNLLYVRSCGAYALPIEINCWELLSYVILFIVTLILISSSGSYIVVPS